MINLENLSYQRHYYWPGITIFRELLSMFEANYPERTKRIIVVRAPKVFPMAYNLIKPFMDEVTREKVVVLGSESILEIIESFCVLCWNSHVQFQTTGRKGYKSTSVQTSSPRLMVEPDVSQILTAQTT